MHVQKIILLIQRCRAAVRGGARLKSHCARGPKWWKTDCVENDGRREKREREKIRDKKKRRKMQIDPRARKEHTPPARRNCLRNVFANGERMNGGGIAFAVRN